MKKYRITPLSFDAKLVEALRARNGESVSAMAKKLKDVDLWARPPMAELLASVGSASTSTTHERARAIVKDRRSGKSGSVAARYGVTEGTARAAFTAATGEPWEQHRLPQEGRSGVMPGHVRKRGSKWRARFPDPLRGGTAQIERSFATKVEAQDWLLDMQHSAKSGQFIDPAASARTLGDVVGEWRQTWTDLEPKTKAGYESILNKHILPRFGRARLSAITPDAVQKMVNELAKDHAPNTTRRVFTVLRSILALAVRRRYLASNAAEAAKLPKKAPRNRERLYLSAAEVRQLAEAMPARYRVAVYVAAYCGLRAGELWALRRRDVDLLHGELHVRQALKDINTTSTNLTPAEKGLLFGPTKTHAARKLSLPDPIKDMLAEHLSGIPGSPDALIFTAPEGGPVRHGLFYARAFKPTLRGVNSKDPKKRRDAALPKPYHALRWHDLRHTCAALSLEVSPNLAMVQARLGHEDIRTTINIYGHLLPSVEAALAEGLTATFNATNDENVVALRR